MKLFRLLLVICALAFGASLSTPAVDLSPWSLCEIDLESFMTPASPAKTHRPSFTIRPRACRRAARCGTSMPCPRLLCRVLTATSVPHLSRCSSLLAAHLAAANAGGCGKHCSDNSVPCGNACISKDKTCQQTHGNACSLKKKCKPVRILHPRPVLLLSRFESPVYRHFRMRFLVSFRFAATAFRAATHASPRAPNARRPTAPLAGV